MSLPDHHREQGIIDVSIWRSARPLRSALVTGVLAISLLTAGCGPEGDSKDNSTPTVTDGKGDLSPMDSAPPGVPVPNPGASGVK